MAPSKGNKSKVIILFINCCSYRISKSHKVGEHLSLVIEKTAEVGAGWSHVNVSLFQSSSGCWPAFTLKVGWARVQAIEVNGFKRQLFVPRYIFPLEMFPYGTKHVSQGAIVHIHHLCLTEQHKHTHWSHLSQCNRFAHNVCATPQQRNKHTHVHGKHHTSRRNAWVWLWV